MSIQDLIKSFSTNSWIPLSKGLISILKTLDKKILNFQLYFNPKKYNSTNKVNYTDKERYDTLIGELIVYIKNETTLKMHTINYDNWVFELENWLKQESVYNCLSTNYLKGSYNKVIDDINRLLIPKTNNEDDEDNNDLTDSIKKWVKYYSYDFDNYLQFAIDNGFLLYKNEIKTKDDDMTPICIQMLEQENQLFSIYAVKTLENENEIIGLWVGNDLPFEPIEKNEYLEFVTNPEFVFNLNPEHQTNIDTVKRNYINKQFDLFTLHVKMLIKNNEMFFYKGKYLHSEDYNTYSELQFTNAVNSFPISFEDYTKNAFALFYFTKEEELTINSYWITTKPIDNLLSTFDKELFEWSESNINDFLTSESTHKTEHFSILH